MSSTIYNDMIQPKGAAYRASQLETWSHYLVPVDDRETRMAGNSRIWGDASPEVQSRMIDILIEASRNAGLDVRNTAHVLAIARIESGFNPDAAAGTSSATGLGQFINKTGAAYGIDDTNRFDARIQARALVAHYIDNRDLATRRGQGEAYIYKYHHDGPVAESGGLDLSERKVMPLLDRYTNFVERHPGFQHASGPSTSDDAPQGPLSRGFGASPDEDVDTRAVHVLREGCQGADVHALQTKLRALGFDDAQGRPLDDDGRFGARTGEAVRAFQQAHGLAVDGIVGAETRSALASASRDGLQTPDGAGAVSDPVAPLDRLFAAARGDDPAAFRAVLTDFSQTAFGRSFQTTHAEHTADLERQARTEQTAQDAPQR